MTKQETKMRILEQGASLIHAKGFHNTGIQEILQAADVPKGSFYFYFKNKEDFGLEVIEYFSQYMGARMGECFNTPDTRGLAQLKNFFDALLVFFEEAECRLGCPIGNMTQELGDISPRFRQRLEKSLSGLQAGIAECLESARKRNEIPSSLDVEEMAHFIVNSWEGAVLRMKAVKSVEPLVVFDKMIFKLLRGE